MNRAPTFLWGTVVVLVGLLPGERVWAQSYIGAERCKSCHEFAYKIWASGPHAKAHEALTDEQLDDPKCNTCHTMLPEQRGERDARFAGVQCERCHGGGQYYHRSYVMRDRELARAVGLVDPKPEHCQQCHTEGAPSILPFDFKTMWARIDHGKAARERWEKERGARQQSSEGPSHSAR